MTSFPIFDPITLVHTANFPRDVVHHRGYWHKGIQANLIRKNSQGTFDIFVQIRSDMVDIGKCKFDQSLATQMIGKDNLDEETCLRRGLEEELSITQCTYVHLPLHLRVMKQYAEYPDVINREIISLYLVQSNQSPNYARCKRIKKGYWQEWKSFVNAVQKTKNKFTKTVQMYILFEEIRNYIEENSYSFLSDNKLNKMNATPFYLGIFRQSKESQFHKLHEKDFSHILMKECQNTLFLQVLSL